MKPSGFHRKGLVTLASGLVVAALLTACGSSDSNSNDGGGEGTLVVALSGSPRALNYVGYKDDGGTYIFSGSVVEGLTGLSQKSDGSTEVKPVLAESWSRVDPLNWEFKLRTGVKFQDGAPFTAKDVVYSWGNWIQKDSEILKVLSNIDTVTAIDDTTVNIKTNSATAFLDRAIYAMPIVPDGWDDNADADKTVIGTGPYKLASASSALDNFVLEKDENYWGDNADAFDKIEFKVVPEASSRSAMLQTGEANVALNLTPDDAATATDVIHVAGSDVNAFRLGIDDNPLLQDLNVRKAINMAVDRQSIVDNIRQGFSQLPQAQIIPSTSIGFNPDLEDYPYDPEQAKQLITDAGATGETIEMICSTETFGDAARDTCSIINQNLTDIGLKVDFKDLGTDAYLEAYYAPDQGRPVPAMTFVPIGNETLTADVTMLGTWNCDATANGFCRPDIWQRVQDISAMEDPDAQAQEWQVLASDLKDLATHLQIDVPEVIFGTDGTVTGPVYATSGAGSGDMTWADWRKS